MYCTTGVYQNMGQNCAGPERFLVYEGVYDHARNNMYVNLSHAWFLRCVRGVLQRGGGHCEPDAARAAATLHRGRLRRALHATGKLPRFVALRHATINRPCMRATIFR